MEITKNDLIDFDCDNAKKDQEIILDLVTTKYRIRYRGTWELFVIFSPLTYSMVYYDSNLKKVIKRLKEIVFCK